MNTPAKLASYAAALALVLGAGAGVGAAVGPVDGDDGAGHAADAPHAEGATAGDGDDASTGHGAPHQLPGGLSASRDGYTLLVHEATFAAGATGPFSFHIEGPDGTTVQAFDTRHERQLHLVVVAHDLGEYQHLHPELAADGTWTTDLALPHGGTYRVYADFAASGAQPLTLATDVVVPGVLEPRPLPAPAGTAAVDGYDVRLHGEVGGELRFTVERDGRAVDDLEPYLGAYGHLVAIRAGDHAYLHVHPTEASSPEQVAFAVEVPSPGRYRLFLDFQHEGVVRTAAFTIEVPGGAGHGADHGARAGTGAGDGGH